MIANRMAPTFSERLTAGWSSVRSKPWTVASTGVALLLMLPLLSVAVLALASTGTTWPHLMSNVLPSSLSNTVLLMAGAGTGALLIGTASAWVVTMYRFPGRDIADRLLVLPLAMPAYIVAYAYVDLLDYAGPVQSMIRHAFDYRTPADYSFPAIRSLGGATMIFALVLYPYVYLSARASFVQQSVCVLEVARTLGRSAGQTFWSIALPLARPAIAAGLMLVLMESLNDLGAVQYLGVETLSASVFTTWTQRGSLAGAAQISLVMLMLIVVLLLAERAFRGLGGVAPTTGRYRAIPFETLTGWRAYGVLALIFVPVALGFLLPAGTLAFRAVGHLADQDIGNFLIAARNSLSLSLVVASICVLLALLFAYTARLEGGRLPAFTSRAVTLGYALPGTVLAIGLISPLAGFDNMVDGWMRETFGISTGLLLSGSLFAVSLALAIRFLAVALATVTSGLGRISPNLDAAARTLGSGGLTTLKRIHLPMLTPALGAAALLVFVDTMKELPATLLLRPFNFDTLATHVYGLMAAEQPEEAALGALTIVVIGLLPVIWLHRAVADGRSGSGR
jgi:iron(III) transport system permease protein